MNRIQIPISSNPENPMKTSHHSTQIRPARYARIGALAAMLAMVAALVLTACVQTEPNGGGTENGGAISLTGRVIGTGNTPISGVVVKLAHNGVTDTTDSFGRYVLSKATSEASTGVVLDTLQYSKNGQALARVSVLQWIDTLPDVEVIQRDISGLLTDSNTVITRVESVVLGDGIDSAFPVVTEFYFNSLTRNYSGFVYFPPATSLKNYSVQINIYGTDDLRIGRSQVVPFNSFAGNITVPPFGASNARPVAKAGIDTAVALGSAIELHGAAVDSFGGTISKWEWNLDGAGFVTTSSGDTTFSRATHGAYPCILRVTDNEGNQALDTVIVASVSHGVNWVSRTSGTSTGLLGVTWTGTQFVAVGGTVVLTSPDGISWTPVNMGLGSTGSLFSIVWTGKHLIATTSTSSLGSATYYYSTDGITWSANTLPRLVANQSGPMIASAVDSTVFISSQSSTNRFLARSPDHGVTWFVDTLPPVPSVNGPISTLNHFARQGSLIVGVGSNGISATSTGDGIWTWRTDMGSFPRPYGGVYDYTMQSVVSTGTHVVAVGYSGHVMRSTDGITWPTPRIAAGIPNQEAGGSAGDLTGVAWTGNTLVAVGNGTTVLSADNGETWAMVQKETAYLRAIAWNGTRLVAVGQGGTIVTSP
jgi:hypothetical protein